ELEARLGVPVVADNDATCAAWGEYRLGAGRGLSDVVMVTLGTGIGGGVVCGNRIYRGVNGFAGEIGHVVVDPHGPPCLCGQRGNETDGDRSGRAAPGAVAARVARVTSGRHRCGLPRRGRVTKYKRESRARRTLERRECSRFPGSPAPGVRLLSPLGCASGSRCPSSVPRPSLR